MSEEKSIYQAIYDLRCELEHTKARNAELMAANLNQDLASRLDLEIQENEKLRTKLEQAKERENKYFFERNAVMEKCESMRTKLEQARAEVTRLQNAIADIKAIACDAQGDWLSVDKVYIPNSIDPYRDIYEICLNVEEKNDIQSW